jgi:hypothetical protein
MRKCVVLVCLVLMASASNPVIPSHPLSQQEITVVNRLSPLCDAGDAESCWSIGFAYRGSGHLKEALSNE